MILLLTALAADPTQGAVLAGLASCRACHTAEGAEFAGGHAVVTPFGTFYGSNLTPDPEFGLGSWAFEDFKRAMRHGKAPDGRGYWPAFPFEDFQQMTEADLADLWAYLQTLEPVNEPAPEHEGPAGWKRWAWRTLYFRQKPVLDGAQGQYLVDAVGHCGACHTPRKKRGQRRQDAYLQGGSKPFNEAPPIDPTALASWDEADLQIFLEMGMLPDGDFVGKGMFGIVDHGTSKLSEADRAAIATWLLQR